MSHDRHIGMVYYDEEKWVLEIVASGYNTDGSPETVANVTVALLEDGIDILVARSDEAAAGAVTVRVP